MDLDCFCTLESAASGIPVDLVSHHCPGNNSDLSGQCDSCFLLASPLSPVNVLVGLLRPLVIPQGARGAFHQDGSQQPAPSFGDMPVAIGLSRLLLFGDQTPVAGQLPNVLEAVGIVDSGDQRLGGFSSDSGNGHQTLRVGAFLGNLFQTLFDCLQ